MRFNLKPLSYLLFTLMLLFSVNNAFATATINKQFSPATVDPGDTVKFRITLYNSSLVPLTSSAVTDNMPDEIKIASPTNIVNTCGFTVVSANSDSSQIILTNGTIPAGTGTQDGSCYFEIDAVSVVSGNWPNTIPANGPSNGFIAGDNVSGFQAYENTVLVTNTTSATATLAVRTLAPLTGSESYSPTTIYAGDPSTLTIVLNNPNTSATVPLTSFTRILPLGVVVAKTPTPTINCTGTGASNGTFSPSADDTSITLTGGIIGKSGSCTITVKVTAPSVTTSPQIFTSTYPANPIGNIRGLSSTVTNASLTANTALTVTKSFIGSPIYTGDNATLVITVTNRATYSTINIDNLTDTLPTGLFISNHFTPLVNCIGTDSDNGTLKADTDSRVIELTNAVIGTGGNKTCIITVPVSSYTTGVHTNTIAANSIQTNPSLTHASTSANLTVNSALTVSKSFSPSTINIGESSTLTITLRNRSSVALNITDLTDSFPSGMIVANPVNPSINCIGTGADNGTLTATSGSTSINLSNAIIGYGSGDTCTISLSVTTTDNGTFTNSISGSDITTNPSITYTGVNTNLTVQSPINVTKSFSPTTINAGDSGTITINITNASTLSTITNVGVTDILPTGITISAGTQTVDCTSQGSGGVNGTVNAIVDNDTIELSGATIGTGGRCSVTVPIKATTTLSSVSRTNTILADNVTSDQDYPSPKATANVTIRTPIVLAKSFSPSTIIAGEKSTLTITITNRSSTNALSITSFTDNLPAALSIADSPSSSVNCTGTGADNGSLTATAGTNSITLANAIIGSGGNRTCVITVPVTTKTTGTHTNSILANSVLNPDNYYSNSVSVPLQVNTPIGLTKSFATSPISSGGISTLTITATNNSTLNTLDIISLTDALPSGLTIADSPSSSVTCTGTGAVNGTLTATPSTGTITLSGAIIGNGSGTKTCTITVPVTGQSANTYTNTIAANSLSNTNNYPSPLATANLTINPKIIVSKNRNKSTAYPLEPVTFTIVLSNWTNGIQATNVNFTDSLPISSGKQLVLSNSVNLTTSAGCIGGTFTANSGGTSVSWSGGTIEAGTSSAAGTCTISFNANAPADTASNTSFTNNIAIGAVTAEIDNVSVSNTSAASASFTTAVTNTIIVAKSFTPSTNLKQLSSAVLEITLTNNSTTALTGVRVTDNLPSSPGQLKVASTPNISYDTSCGTPVIDAVAGASSIAISNVSLTANGGICKVRVSVSGVTTGTYSNTIPSLSVLSNEGMTNQNSSNTATLSIVSALSATMSFTPSSTTSGGNSKVILTITNNSLSTLTNLSVANTLGTSLNLNTPTGAVTTCGGSPVITAVSGGTSISMTGATLSAGSSCQLIFDVKTSGTPASWTNTISAGGITSNEGVTNSSAVSATLNKLSNACIGINKSFNPTGVTGGQVSLLQIDITNPLGSPSTVDNVSFTDTFPVGMEIALNSNAYTTCTGGLITAIPGSSSISLTGATIPTNTTCSVFVNVTSVKFLNLTNTIPIGALTTTQGYNNCVQTQASLSTLQGLGAMKAFQPQTISVGQKTQLQIRLISTLDPNAANPITLHGVSFTDPLPTGLTISSEPNASTTCTDAMITAPAGGNAVTVSGVTLPPATNCWIYVDVEASSLGSYSNIIASDNVTSTEGYKNQYPAIATLTVLEPPTIGKTFSNSPVDIGTIVTLTIQINNNDNNTDLTAISLIDNFPSGVVIAPTPNASTNCTNGTVTAAPAGNSLILTGAILGRNSSCWFKADVMSNYPGFYINTIPAGALSTLQGATNIDNVSDVLNVWLPPLVDKSFSPSSINTNGTSKLTISLINPNEADITMTSNFTDTFPTGLVIESPNGITGTCNLSNVTAVSGSNYVSYPSGSVIPAGGCTIEVDVTASANGTYTNTISSGALITDRGSNDTPSSDNLSVYNLPTISKDFSPNTIKTDQTSRLTITLGNTNNESIYLTSNFTDTFPTGLVVTSPNGISGTCNLDNVTAVSGSNSVSYVSGSAITAGGCTIEVDVTASADGTYTNTISSGALITNIGSNDTPASDNLSVYNLPMVNKDFSPNTIKTDQTSRLTITLGNPNNESIYLTSNFTDTFPTGLVVASPNGITGTCNLSNVTAVSGSNSVSYASGSAIPAGGCTIIVNVASSSINVYENYIEAGSLITNAGSNTEPANDNLTVQAAYVFDPPIGIKTSTLTGLPALQWKMVWINGGNAMSELVRVVDNITTGTTYVTGSLKCEARGSSTVISCYYDAANKRVIYEGFIAPDLGATNEATALNEVVITFLATFDNGIQDVTNKATAYWDKEGDGDIDDDITDGEEAVITANQFNVPRPTDVPAFNLIGTLILTIFTGIAAFIKRRKK